MGHVLLMIPRSTLDFGISYICPSTESARALIKIKGGEVEVVTSDQRKNTVKTIFLERKMRSCRRLNRRRWAESEKHKAMGEAGSVIIRTLLYKLHVCYPASRECGRIYCMHVWPKPPHHKETFERRTVSPLREGLEY